MKYHNLFTGRLWKSYPVDSTDCEFDAATNTARITDKSGQLVAEFYAEEYRLGEDNAQLSSSNANITEVVVGGVIMFGLFFAVLLFVAVRLFLGY